MQSHHNHFVSADKKAGQVSASSAHPNDLSHFQILISHNAQVSLLTSHQFYVSYQQPQEEEEEDEEEVNSKNEKSILFEANKLVQGDYEVFIAEIVDGKNAFKTKNEIGGSNMYLTVLSNGTVTLSPVKDKPELNSLFFVQVGNNGQVSLLSTYGTFISVENDTCCLKAKSTSTTAYTQFKIYSI